VNEYAAGILSTPDVGAIHIVHQGGDKLERYLLRQVGRRVSENDV